MPSGSNALSMTCQWHVNGTIWAMGDPKVGCPGAHVVLFLIPFANPKPHSGHMWAKTGELAIPWDSSRAFRASCGPQPPLWPHFGLSWAWVPGALTLIFSLWFERGQTYRKRSDSGRLQALESPCRRAFGAK